MVAVVVDEHDLACGGIDLAEALETPVDALELLECRDHGGVTDLQLVGNGNCGQRVLHVVQTGQTQLLGDQWDPPAPAVSISDYHSTNNWNVARAPDPAKKKAKA